MRSTLCSLSTAFIAMIAMAEGGARADSVRIGTDSIPERIALAEVRAFEKLVVFRDSHPVLFDQNHLFYGQLLTDRTFMDAIERRWEEHPRRVDYYQPFLGRVLVGYYLLTDMRPLVPIDPQPSVIPNPDPVPPNSSGSSGSGGGPGIHTNVVPEPSSMVLCIMAGASLILCASRRIGRR